MTAREILWLEIAVKKVIISMLWEERRDYIKTIKENISTIRELQSCLNYLNNVTFKNKWHKEYL